DWSYALLPEHERGLLRRAAVFVGGWTLEALQSLCGNEVDAPRADGRESSPPPPPAAGRGTMDLLACLVENSLVVPAEVGGEIRFGLLETIREYALEKLREEGELEGAR